MFPFANSPLEIDTSALPVNQCSLSTALGALKESHVEHAEKHVEHAEKHVEYAEKHAEYAEKHVEHAEKHAEYAEKHAEYAEKHAEYAKKHVEHAEKHAEHTEKNTWVDAGTGRRLASRATTQCEQCWYIVPGDRKNPKTNPKTRGSSLLFWRVTFG